MLESRIRSGRARRGPRTPAGKARSRRNALRHGLAASRDQDRGECELINTAVQALGGGDQPGAGRREITDLATAQLDLMRVRTVRARITGEIESMLRSDNSNLLPDHLDQLLRLERYERRALSKRKIAARRLFDL